MPRPPRAPGDIVGRVFELRAVRHLLLDPHARLVTLAGPAGIGKTRLALALTKDDKLRAEFVDGVAFVDLSHIEHATDVLGYIAAQFGLRTRARNRTGLHLQLLLRRRRLLLVLDNFEHVLAAGTEVAALLAGCPWLKILVTSRAALRLRWEHVFPLAPLAAPRREMPADARLAETYSAVALFVRRARAARPDFVLTDANAAAVSEVCSALDGVPLAIELAASRCATLPLSALVRRMRSPLALLESGAADLPARQRTLQSAIDWSVALLRPEERVVFSRLGIFGDGFTAEAAEAVCGGTGGSADVLDTLSKLIRANLLSLVESTDGQHRYELLATVRNYAAQRLAASGEAHTIAARLVDWCIEFLARAADPSIVERESANLLAALRAALAAGDIQRGARLAVGLTPVWTTRGDLEEGRHWLDEVLAGSQDARAEPSVYAAALRAGGWLAELQGDDQQARTWYARAARIAEQAGDTVQASLAYTGRARLEVAAGQVETGLSLLVQALNLVREQPSSIAAAAGVDALAWCAAQRGHPELAISLASAADAICEAARTRVERGPRHVEILAQARAAVGADQASALRQQAGDLDLERALELCQEWLAPPCGARPATATPLASADHALAGFTRRERDVIRLAALGYTNRQIADQLVVSTRTAEGHVHNILSKLQLPSRAQLAVWAARHGVGPDDDATK